MQQIVHRPCLVLPCEDGEVVKTNGYPLNNQAIALPEDMLVSMNLPWEISRLCEKDSTKTHPKRCCC